MRRSPVIGLAAVLLTWPLTFPALAAEPFEMEQAFATVTRFSEADFVQQRWIPGLDRALLSSGTVSLQGEGFTWHQHLPFTNTLVFDGIGINETTMTAGGPVSRPLNDAAVTGMTRTLYGMMSGSWNRLRSEFEILNAAPDGERAWTLRLIPRDEAVRAFMPEIRVSGNRFLEEIRVRQQDEGQIRIELANHRTAP
jgi:hypothetical protein